MQLPKDCPTTQATIQGIIVTIPAPFVEGHVCTPAEAQVLNQTMVENIRNNRAAKVQELVEKAKAAAEATGADYTPPTGEAQALVDAYIPEYEFGARRGGGGRIVDPVEAEAWSIAERLVKDAIRAKGGTIKSYEDKLDMLVAKTLEKNPNIRKDAAEVVKRRQKSANATLDLASLED